MCDIKSVLYYDSKLCIFHSHRGLTCHYCAYQKKDAQEDVSCQRAVIVNDLALANGEYNSEHLCVGAEHGVVRIKASACTHPGRMQTKPRPFIFIHLGSSAAGEYVYAPDEGSSTTHWVFANISRTVAVMLREYVLPAYEQALQMHKQNYEINI